MKTSIVFALLLCSAAFAQQPPTKVEFEVASIKPSAPQPLGRVMIRMNVDDGMLRYTNVALKDCIRTAYRVKDFQVQGPDWLGSARFDIDAKLPDGASKDQVPEMLQALLADRFKLTIHRENKEHPVYALVAGKNGPKLKPAEDAPDGGAVSIPKSKDGGSMPRGNMMIQMDRAGAHLKAPSATLANLADIISRFSERPVIDMTGIEGQYDFDLVFSPETLRGVKMMGGGRMPPPQGGAEQPPAEERTEAAGSIYDSVQKYGLKLEPRKAPLDIIVVDHIEKTPTEN